MEELSLQHVTTIRDAARRMKGHARRTFEAQVCLDYFCGDAQLAETVFGWSRHTVAKGLKELATGQEIKDLPRSGRPRSEEKDPHLLDRIREIVEPHTQTDPKFQGLFQYTRMTAKAVRQALIDEKGYDVCEVPSENTIGEILNRMNYKLRRVQKAKPQKKLNKPTRSSRMSTA